MTAATGLASYDILGAGLDHQPRGLRTNATRLP